VLLRRQAQEGTREALPGAEGWAAGRDAWGPGWGSGGD